MYFEYTLYSRKFKQAFTFVAPGTPYIFIDWNGEPGTLNLRICDGEGMNAGSTMEYHGD